MWHVFVLDHEQVWVGDDHRSSVFFFYLDYLGGISIENIEMCRHNPQNFILAVIKRPMIIQYILTGDAHVFSYFQLGEFVVWPNDTMI